MVSSFLPRKSERWIKKKKKKKTDWGKEADERKPANASAVSFHFSRGCKRSGFCLRWLGSKPKKQQDGLDSGGMVRRVTDVFVSRITTAFSSLQTNIHSLLITVVKKSVREDGSSCFPRLRLQSSLLKRTMNTAENSIDQENHQFLKLVIQKKNKKKAKLNSKKIRVARSLLHSLSAFAAGPSAPSAYYYWLSDGHHGNRPEGASSRPDLPSICGC